MMKYGVFTLTPGQPEYYRGHGLSKRQAVRLAKELADTSDKDTLVFVEWSRASDGQRGFLNPDGNHSVTGESWSGGEG